MIGFVEEKQRNGPKLAWELVPCEVGESLVLEWADRMTKEEYGQLGLEDGREVSLQIRNYRVLSKEDSALPVEQELIYRPPPSIAENI